MKMLLHLLIAALLVPVASASPALLQAVTLPGTATTTTWTNLSNTNPTLAAASNGHGASLAVQSPGFRASGGFYAFSGPYTFTSTVPAGSAPETVVLQFVAGLRDEFTLAQYLGWGGGPVLNYTTASGSGTLSPFISGAIAGPTPATVAGFAVDYTNLAFQWDLSSLGEVLGWSIVSGVPIHTSVTAYRIDSSDSFSAAVVPEPSAAGLLAGLAGLGCVALRRRR